MGRLLAFLPLGDTGSSSPPSLSPFPSLSMSLRFKGFITTLSSSLLVYLFWDDYLLKWEAWLWLQLNDISPFLFGESVSLWLYRVTTLSLIFGWIIEWSSCFKMTSSCCYLINSLSCWCILIMPLSSDFEDFMLSNTISFFSSKEVSTLLISTKAAISH